MISFLIVVGLVGAIYGLLQLNRRLRERADHVERMRQWSERASTPIKVGCIIFACIMFILVIFFFLLISREG